MITGKHTTKIAVLFMALFVCLCLCAVVFSENIEKTLGDPGVSLGYETALFNTDEILQLNILMDENDWEDMLKNAASEKYYQCDVEVNGTTFYRVGIRPKGNTSLNQIVADPDNNRYSLKLEFDQYVDGQTCFGLDKLILNNNFADATNMKEALIFDMYRYIGADASLYNYARISVNGEYWGVYLALEAVEDSFLVRNYGTKNGELYKPENMNMGEKPGKAGDGQNQPQPPNGQFDLKNMPQPRQQGGEPQSPPDGQGMPQPPGQQDGQPGDMPQMPSDGQNMPQMPDGQEMPQMPDGQEMPQMPDGQFDPQNMPFNAPPGGMGGGFFMGSGGGADLNYHGDELENYATIWNCEITKSSKKDHKRVVTALKNISEGNELEAYMDTDNLLKYAAVHVFSVNMDSLSGNMTHNYYLYENDGRLNLLPWDYNLILGGMGGSGDATRTVNSPIDDAFTSTNFFDKLLEDESYHAQYYENLQRLVDEYLLGGGFQSFYERTRSQIDELVRTDPNALYSYEEYEKALDTLCEVVKLRAQSIEGQLEGDIPSTESGQKNSDCLIDASSLDLSVMGTMDMGDDRGGFEDRENRMKK